MAALEDERGCHNEEYSAYKEARAEARATEDSLSLGLSTHDDELDKIKEEIAAHEQMKPKKKRPSGKTMSKKQKQNYAKLYGPWHAELMTLKEESERIQRRIESARSSLSSQKHIFEETMSRPEAYFCSKVLLAVTNQDLTWEWFKNKQLKTRKAGDPDVVIQFFTSRYMYDGVAYRIVGHVHGHYPEDVWAYDPDIPDKYDVMLRRPPYTAGFADIVRDECYCHKTTVSDQIYRSIGDVVLAQHQERKTIMLRHPLDYAHEQYEDQYVHQQSELIAYDLAFVGIAALFIISCALCLCISGVVGYIVGRCAGNKSVHEYENENIV